MAEKAEGGMKGPTKFNIQIDRVHFVVTAETLTGADLRQLPSPPIGSDRDLFEVVPGDVDRKLENDSVAVITNGKRFFTAPSHINPGVREVNDKCLYPM